MKRALFEKISLLLVVILGLSVMAACGDDDDTEPLPGDKAMLRAVHLSPDAPTVDILANATMRAVSSLAFGQGTGYLEVDAGTYDLDVVPVSGTVAESVLNVSGAQLMKDVSYTAVAYGMVDNIAALLLEDNYADLDDGNIRVRAIHTADGVGEVDIWNIPDTGDPAIAWENVPYGAVGDYLDLPAGAYTLGIDLDNDASPDAVYKMPALAAGAVGNVFAVKEGDDVYLLAQLKDGSITKIMAESMAETADLRVIHLSPDAPAVDILANGPNAIFEDLTFGNGSAYLSVDPGTYDVLVVPADGAPADQVLSITGLTLGVDKSYTVAALGMLNNLSSVVLEDDYADLDAANIRVRAIHAADGVGEVDIWNIPDTGDPALLYENVGYGTVGDYMDLPAGAYTLGFDVDNDATPDLIFKTPDLAAGTVANIFAVKDGDDVYLLVQLKDGSVAKIMAEAAADTAMLRVFHLSPDAPAVDVLANDTVRAVTNLVYSECTDYLDLDVGTYTFDVVPVDGAVGDSVLNIADLALTKDMSYTAVAYGELSNIAALALVDDYSGLGAGNIRVRAVHAADGVGEVDIWNIPDTGDPAMLYENVGYGVAGDFMELPAGTYTLGIDTDDDATPDLVFEMPALAEGAVVSIFAVMDTDVYLLALLADGTVVQVDASTM